MTELQRGWKIVFACCIGICCSSSAIPFYTLGAFTVPLGADFGWSRAEIQGAISFLTLGGLFTIPIAGMLVDKFGPRRVALISLCAFAITFANIGLTTSSLFIFYANWTLMSALSAGTTPITWTRAVNGWFDKNRGIALGFALTGTGLAGIFTPNLATYLIQEFGWRHAFVGLSMLPILVALPIVYFFFRDPPEDRTQAAGEQQTVASGSHGVTLRKALKGRYFWTIAVAFFLISIGIGGTIPNLIPMLQDGGLAPATAAGVVGAIGLSVIFGRIIAGYLIDRFWAPGVAFVMLSLPAVSCLILAGDVQSVGKATIAAAIIGLAAGAEFDLISYLTSRYFGLKHYGKIYARQFAAFSIGAGLAPPVFGRVFDLYGSYRPILIAAAIMYVVGSATLLTLGKYPNLLKVGRAKHLQ